MCNWIVAFNIFLSYVGNFSRSPILAPQSLVSHQPPAWIFQRLQFILITAFQWCGKSHVFSCDQQCVCSYCAVSEHICLLKKMLDLWHVCVLGLSWHKLLNVLLNHIQRLKAERGLSWRKFFHWSTAWIKSSVNEAQVISMFGSYMVSTEQIPYLSYHSASSWQWIWNCISKSEKVGNCPYSLMYTYMCIPHTVAVC